MSNLSEPMQARSIVNDYPLCDLAQDVLQRLRAKGASQAEVAASISKGFSTTVRLGEVDTVEHNRDRGFDITVYFGQHKGQASSTDLSRGAIDEAIDAACAIAKYIAEDACVGLADPELLAKTIPDLGLYHPIEFTPEQGIEVARECEAIGLAFHDKITNSEGASFSMGEAYYVYANSHDFIGAIPTTYYSLNCCLVATSGHGMERDYEYTTARNMEHLWSRERVAKRAAEKALARLDARRLATVQAPVLFTPELARGLIGSLVSAISGGNLYRKTTFLLDKLHQPICAPWMQLIEHPHIHSAMGSVPFDHEGVATPAERIFVDEGVLQSYVLGSYSARRLGLQTTGNSGGVHNLTLNPNAGDQLALLAQMGRGLLVTELIGNGVNLVTGDYSRGAAGFWVENGQIQYPVHEITIAGNLQDMFKDCVAAGSDVDCRGSIRSGSILLKNMIIAGE